MPSGVELAEMLAADAGFPWADGREMADLAMVSSYYVDVSPDRDVLRNRLRTIFSREHYRCNALHRLLARLAKGLMILTTNYDTLIEQAFLEIGKPFDVYVYPADNPEFRNAILWWRDGATEPQRLKPNELDSREFEDRNVIYKVHGSVRAESRRWDSFVITEEDYVDFLSRMNSRSNAAVPAAFKSYFTDRAFLFLGYGLRDWNLRVLIKQLGLTKLSSAILHNPSKVEEELWRKRQVKIYDLTLEEFVKGMEAEQSKTTASVGR
jgi:hypothetical protein